MNIPIRISHSSRILRNYEMNNEITYIAIIRRTFHHQLSNCAETYKNRCYGQDVINCKYQE